MKLWKILFINAVIIIAMILLLNLEKNKFAEEALFWLIALGFFATILEVQVYFCSSKRKREAETLQLKENFSQWYLDNEDRQYETYWVGLEKLTLFQISLEIMGNTKVGQKILKEIKKEGGIENVFCSQKEPCPCCPAIEEVIPG